VQRQIVAGGEGWPTDGRAAAQKVVAPLLEGGFSSALDDAIESYRISLKPAEIAK
jgi:hypothetical protein